MSKIQKARRIAERIGAEIEYDREMGLLNAWLPAGKNFSANGCHNLCHDFHPGPWANKQIDELISDMQFGVEECEIEDCDVCGEE